MSGTDFHQDDPIYGQPKKAIGQRWEEVTVSRGKVVFICSPDGSQKPYLRAKKSKITTDIPLNSGQWWVIKKIKKGKRKNV